MMRTPVLLAAVLAVGLTACAGDDDNSDTAQPTATRPDGTEPAAGLAVGAGEPFPTERCTANEAAGTIDYLTGFDYAATASILEVIVAESAGYYDELCLDVEITPSFSVANFPLVAAGEACAARWDTVTDDDRGRTGDRSDGSSFTVDTFARYFLHDPVHHLVDVRTGYADLDRATPA